MSKTCGECRFFESKEFICCHSGDEVEANYDACYEFEPPKLTNGDRIWQSGDRERAEFLWKLYNGHICSFCVFLVADDDRKQVICKRPPDKTCTDGVEAWLAAPAESEVKDEQSNLP